jgi:SRSO17 transposase
MQRLLRRADWDVDGVRDDIRGYVAGQLGEPAGVLLADDTGFLKRAPGRRESSGSIAGTAGRTENCQVGVFLAYASAHGHALIDRELYLPRSLVQAWAPDPGSVWCWSRWRRRRQYQARLCHYRRRGYALT